MKFAGVSHPGLIGTAPSAELLATWTKRESELVAEHGADCVQAVAFLPEPKGAYVGQELSAEMREKIEKEGARTIPGREHGGNCDVTPIFSVLSLVLLMYFCLTFRLKICPGVYRFFTWTNARLNYRQWLSLLLPGLRKGRKPVRW